MASVASSLFEQHFVPFVNNKGAGQPAYQHRMISTLAVRCPESVIGTCAKPNILTALRIDEQVCRSLLAAIFVVC